MIHGKHPLLLNVTYIRPGKDTNGNDIKEHFEVIYQGDDGIPRKSDEPPNADIYFVKPEFRNFNYNKPEEMISHLYKVTVPISKIRYKIAEEMGDKGKEFVRDAVARRDFKRLDQLYKWPYAFHCDFQPEYYFMRTWYDKYPIPDKFNLSTAFLDIETDGIDHIVDLESIPDTAYSPVNCVTINFDDKKESYTLVLKPYVPSRMGRTEEEYQERYQMYEKQLKDHKQIFSHLDEFIKDVHNRFDNTYGYIDYHVKEFENEIDLIAYLFFLINTKKPNFCEIWNMRFDIQYLYYRIITLGYDPRSIMCHEDFKNPKCYFKVDKTTFKIEKQFDYFYCSSYTQFMCQMRMYGSIRKSQHQLRSISLNAIADRELGDQKVEYEEEGNITQFMYSDWPRFIIYNIKDTLLQFGIEHKTNDIMTYYMRSQENMTPYNKIFRETHLLRNVREIYFEKDGWVQGNNINIIDDDKKLDEDWTGSLDDDDDEDDEASFKGAINADPIWNAKIGLEIYGKPTNYIFRNAMDYDMGAFYPSSKIASNMGPTTLLFKGAFDNQEFISGEMSNRSLNQIYFEKDKKGNTRRTDFTGEAVNSYCSHNILTFCYNYLNMPSITELDDIVTGELS